MVRKMSYLDQSPRFGESLSRLWSYISPRRRRQLVLLFVLMVLASIAEVVSIGAVLPFLGVLTTPDKVFAYPMVQKLMQSLELVSAHQLMLPLTLAFVVAALISGLMRLLLLWGQSRMSFAIGADLSCQVYIKTLYQPYEVHISRNSSEVISGIATKTTSVTGTLMYLLLCVSSAFILLAILIFMIVIDPTISLMAFCGIGLVYGAILFLTRKRVAIHSQRISYEHDQVIKVLQEGLGGIRDVLIDGAQSTYSKIYQKTDLSLRRSQASMQIIAGAPRFMVEAFGMVLIAALAYGLSRSGSGITSAIPMLGTFALGAQRLLPALQQVYNGWTSARGGQTSLEDVLALLDQPLPKHANSPTLVSLPFERSIELRNVSFRYTPCAPWSLRGINLNIPKGSRIGFIGTTGSGKSTLLDLVMGLLQPTLGTFNVDGTVIKPGNVRSWQAHIAHVPQSIFLADTTIEENIAFGIPRELIDRDRVKRAASQAQIAETIESWDRKYETIVGERGVRLSGGQRQRIGIARALYKHADVLVFDEATSALDNSTETAVMDGINLMDGRITVLIVAHRLTTLKGCTQIIELKGGKVSRVGQYKQIVGE